MFRRIPLRAKPALTIFRRNLVDAEINIPKRVIPEKDIDGPSASLNNGVKGQKTFPSGSAKKNFFKELPKAIQALIAIGTIMIFWPMATVGISNFTHSVPSESTSAVKIGPKGTTTVDIPQTYAHLDKPTEDEDE
ncbi:uncharacterized protein AC631_03882 [Debaryomyces fabryi]|uniref:Uncharacterized protein n=1 Tax=Debaryomyces fabryi TaxID=58627 RepID=A0A0V1PVT6_9ASCO|nr:uncharacterized protein AC631_03882 [Debaryomyces fabryi]KSA00366.1 hypothetical protein AC631_03882 [Debaryomyces fabryi]CUM57225.1 unnamed protein product [Debaryomyces fabryi]